MTLADLPNGSYSGVELYSNETGSLTIRNGSLENQEIGPYEVRLFRISNSTSISTTSPINYSIFPNPSRDLIQIEISVGSSQQYGYEILALDGRLILSGDLQINTGKGEIDLHQLNAGTYLLRLIGNGAQITEKVVKW